MLMNTAFVAMTLGILGLAIGSFAGAQVWRLRKKQLEEDKRAGEEYSATELKRLKHIHGGVAADRSTCLDCGHQLAWYDLLPLASWLSTGGKCRYCHKPIGWFEPTMEVAMAGFFVLSYLLWPYSLTSGLDIAMFAIWLVSGLSLAILFAYDLKWFLLPDRMTWLYAALGAVYAAIAIVQGYASIWSTAIAVTIMSGLYLVLYMVSKGKWIGFGDVKLGIGLGLFLLNWQLALLALFLANLIGTLVVLPGLVTKKLRRDTPIPFGPFLIVGMIIAVLAGWPLIRWYLSAMLL